jgi:hypothetical protein
MPRERLYMEKTMKTFNVYLQSESTYGQTNVGCHYVFHNRKVGEYLTPAEAVAEAVAAVPHGNLRVQIMVEGAPIRALEDARADTAECLRALSQGHPMTIGMGSTQHVLVTTESLEDESTHTIDAENLHYQRTRLGA